jgi:endonuclease-3
MARESKQALKKRALKIIRRLQKAYPDAKCALTHENPLELLVATILSAQCTDKRVNEITPNLFAAFPTVRSFAGAKPATIEKFIRSGGLYKTKARNIVSSMAVIATKYDGRIPHERPKLEDLPGVGRKTANVILFNAFGEPAIAVDTHVLRLSGRLGLSKENTPEKVERDLMKLLPAKDWGLSSHLIISHGRNVCTARRPRCADCLLSRRCPQIGIKKS